MNQLFLILTRQDTKFVFESLFTTFKNDSWTLRALQTGPGSVVVDQMFSGGDAEMFDSSVKFRLSSDFVKTDLESETQQLLILM